MSRNERARLRRRSIGYVFQDFNLLPGLTAVENVALPLELDGIRNQAARARRWTALDQLGLTDRADHYPEELSGGERHAWRSPAPSSATVGCCSPTSRPAPSTRSTAKA